MAVTLPPRMSKRSSESASSVDLPQPGLRRRLRAERQSLQIRPPVRLKLGEGLADGVALLGLEARRGDAVVAELLGRCVEDQDRRRRRRAGRSRRPPGRCPGASSHPGPSCFLAGSPKAAVASSVVEPCWISPIPAAVSSPLTPAAAASSVLALLADGRVAGDRGLVAAGLVVALVVVAARGEGQRRGEDQNECCGTRRAESSWRDPIRSAGLKGSRRGLRRQLLPDRQGDRAGGAGARCSRSAGSSRSSSPSTPTSLPRARRPTRRAATCPRSTGAPTTPSSRW